MVSRTRGDSVVCGTYGFPAHAGIDRPHLRRVPGRHGFPAHAGIDRCSLYMPRLWSRFPRTRGDRPVHLLYARYSPGVGFPAHAGIDPLCVCSTYTDRDGFPAHAGIDRPHLPACSWPPWFPRTRGDRPLPVSLERLRLGFPRTRGDRPWTLAT